MPGRQLTSIASGRSASAYTSRGGSGGESARAAGANKASASSALASAAFNRSGAGGDCLLGSSQQTALDEELRELDGVRGGALSEVVSHDPEIQAALVRGVAPDAADQHLVPPGGFDRHRIAPACRVVD